MEKGTDGKEGEGKRKEEKEVGKGEGNEHRGKEEEKRRREKAHNDINIMQQGNARRAIRIILDRSQLGRDDVLEPLEIYLAELPLMAATDTPHGDAPVAVAPRVLGDALGELLLRLRARDLLEGRTGHEPATR